MRRKRGVLAEAGNALSRRRTDVFSRSRSKRFRLYGHRCRTLTPTDEVLNRRWHWTAPSKQGLIELRMQRINSCINDRMCRPLYKNCIRWIGNAFAYS